MSRCFDKQHLFRSKLVNYINSGCLSRSDHYQAILSPYFPFRKNASQIIQGFRGSNVGSAHFGPVLRIKLQHYASRNSYVLKLIDYLGKNLKEDLIGACVHGSLGTYEEVNYSDFDALVIIRNEVFDNRERLSSVARKLFKAQSIMFEFDPLQHHGWFVLTEQDLNNYPESYFPSVLFQFAKSLLGEQELEIRLCKTDEIDYMSPFGNLIRSIQRNLEIGEFPRNLYRLKCLLSQFMLLPSFYVQARDNCGIFKKYSFSRAKEDFDDAQWAAMRQVSDIRTKWTCRINPMQKYWLKNPSSFVRAMAKTHSPPVPTELSRRLPHEFCSQLKGFVRLLRHKLVPSLPVQTDF